MSTKNLTKPRSLFWLLKPCKSKIPRTVSCPSGSCLSASSSMRTQRRLLSSRGNSPACTDASGLQSSIIAAAFLVTATNSYARAVEPVHTPSSYRVLRIRFQPGPMYMWRQVVCIFLDQPLTQSLHICGTASSKPTLPVLCKAALITIAGLPCMSL